MDDATLPGRTKYGVPGIRWACQSAGPNSHVGIITAIELKGHTLTLKDAETGTPMVFKTAFYLLKTVKVNQEVMITYEMTGKQMTATKIKT